MGHPYIATPQCTHEVKRDHVLRAVDWSYSTFHRYVAEGILPADWGVGAGVDAGFGERR